MKAKQQFMQMKQNPLTGDWLCWIPETSQAYYYEGELSARKFVEKVNAAFVKGELKIVNGKVIKLN